MNWYKKAFKSRLISVPLCGTLKCTDDGFYYLKISNDVIHGLFALIDEENIEKPPYDLGGYKDIGAHISVMSQDELDKDIDITDVGKEFSFKLGKFYSTKPENWDEMERVWFVSVISPELENLRKKYKLPKTYKGKGHDFHMTVAVRKKNRKKAAQQNEPLIPLELPPPIPGLKPNADYNAFLRLKGLGSENDNNRLRAAYNSSKRKGKFWEILHNRLHRELGPGKYWARSVGENYLNNRFVRKTRGA
jgi:hypothetical protein